MYNHCTTIGRTVEMVNLDPAAETFNYPTTVGQFLLLIEMCIIDVRELISVDDVLTDDDLILGPNGALVFCMELVSFVQNTFVI